MSDSVDAARDNPCNGSKPESPTPDVQAKTIPLLNHQSITNTSASREAYEELSRKFESMTPRRVKVYLLRGEDWLDNGTGYCKGEIDPTTKKPYFIVRNELDSLDVILKLYLEGSIQYQRQQETLIVWTDLTGKDLALSFQENDGCAELCEFVIRVQQEGLSPMISLYYVLPTLYDSLGDAPREITELITGPISYPPEIPTLDSLEEIMDLVNQGANSQYTRACILEFILATGYIHKLYLLQDEAEKAKDIFSLHLLSDIVKCILLYNNHSLMEELLSSEAAILDMVSLLEYDRGLPNFKACHRQYLLDESKFRSVIEVSTPSDLTGSDMSIFRKDFFLSYLKNVVFARWMDESTLNTLSTLIYSNQMEIISYLSKPDENDNFLGRLLLLYETDITQPENYKKCCDAVKMLHQYVSVTKGQPSTQKSEFFTALIKAGLIKMIKFALESVDKSIRSIGTEMLVAVIEQDVSLVHCTHYDDNSQVDELDPPVSPASTHPEICEGEDFLQQPHIKLKLYNDTSFTLVLCNLLLTEKSPGLKMQAYEALKTLLTCTATNDNYHDDAFHDTGDSNKSDVDIADINHKFFQTFYRRVASVLFQDFLYIGRATTDPKKIESAKSKIVQEPMLYQHLCDLIAFCFQEHDINLCRNFFIQNDILLGVSKLLTLKIKVTLKLAALRCLKTLIHLNDNQLMRYIMENDLLTPFVEFFETVSDENNLANSLCLDLLEIVLKRGHEMNFKALAIHLYNNHRAFIERIDYVSTGNELVQLVENALNLNADPTATSIDDNDNQRHETVLSPIQGEDKEENASLEEQLSPLNPVKYSPHKRGFPAEDEGGNKNIGCNGNGTTKKQKTDYLSGFKKDGDLKT